MICAGPLCPVLIGINMTKKKPSGDWRDDPGLTCKVFYKRKFALLPVSCSDESKVHLRFYYKKYNMWNTDHYASEYSHTDFVENITEADYMIRKLAETL
jgi:hypothetical protein